MIGSAATKETAKIENFAVEKAVGHTSTSPSRAKTQNELEVFEFFKKNSWPEKEGRKFYAYYETKNWKLSRGLNIQNWKESAKIFVEKGFIIKEEYTSPFSGYVDNLKNRIVKDYDIPL